MIKIISYNVSWESMTNKMYDGSCKNDNCKENILNFLKNNICDFMLIQEASSMENFNLNGMNKISYRSGMEDMILFYNNTYTLGEVCNGEFQSGRPFIIASFKKDDNDIVIINVHLNEAINLYAFKKHKLEGETPNMVEDRLKNVELKKLENNLTKTMKELLEKSTTKIIIAGDFNFDFKITTFPLHLFNRIFKKESEELFTCCDTGLLGINHEKKFDHVLITDNLEITSFIIKLNKTDDNKYPLLYSDHLPICFKLIYKTIDINFENKYLKYKNKYLKLKKYL